MCEGWRQAMHGEARSLLFLVSHSKPTWSVTFRKTKMEMLKFHSSLERKGMKQKNVTKLVQSKKGENKQKKKKKIIKSLKMSKLNR